MGSRKNPPVGKYELNVNPIKEKAPSYKIGTSIRSDLQPFSKNYPSVGKYNIDGKLGNYGPKYSFSSREHDKFKEYALKLENDKSKNKELVTPGPGDYELKATSSIFFRTSGWKFNSEKRDYHPFNTNKFTKPGPGTYDLGKPGKNNKSIFIGKETRKDRKKDDIPGPGHYKIPCSIFDYPTFISTNGSNAKWRYI